VIAKLAGQLVEKHENSLVVNVNGIYYEVMVPLSVMQRVSEAVDSNGNIALIIYHYIQISPSSGTPMLIGFFNEIERDFFQKFITVSGIGPRAAVKALNKPISEIAQAIDKGDQTFLKTLPGIGNQKAKEIIAKLQGKVGMYGLIQDKVSGLPTKVSAEVADWQEEALAVLLQLQYKKPEALDMIRKALERSVNIQTTEELLNEIYKQRTTR
jgi:Holliday junction DNA helicase RuvA